MAKNKTKEGRMYLRVRNLCGFLGLILPWLALFSSGIAEHPSNDWWWSISSTYYQSPALVGVLMPTALILITYIGYDKTDNIITTICGAMAIGIVLFPSKVSWIDAGTPVGFFQVPIEISNILHLIFAGAFFVLSAFTCLFQFTKSDSEMTDKKVIRNRIYRICGIGMLVMEAGLGITFLLGAPGYFIMIIEIVLLQFFGLSWLVKGEFFPFLNDDEEDAAPSDAPGAPVR